MSRSSIPTLPARTARFKLNGEIPDSENQISPRLGLSWAPDDKTAVRFSLGRYWSRTPALLWAQLFTSNGVQAAQLTITCPQSGGVCTGPPTNPLAPGWGTAWVPEGVERIDFNRVGGASAPPGVFTVDPDFENPYTDRDHPGRRARDHAADRSGPRLHLRRGQPAPAPDRHQPCPRRHRGAGERPAALQPDHPEFHSLQPHHHGRLRRRVRVQGGDAHPAAPLRQQLQPLRRGHLVGGPGPRLQRAELRRHPGGGLQQPRQQLGSFDPRPGVEGRAQRRVGHAAVGHRPLRRLPLRHGLAVHPDHQRRRQPATSTPAPTGRPSTASTSAATASASRTSTPSTCGSPRASASAPAT